MTVHMGRTKSPTLRVDPELARISIGLHFASELRLWFVARAMNRQSDGSGKVSKKEFKAILREFGIGYSRQHLRRLLNAGKHLLWNENKTYLYIRSSQHVARVLTQKAIEACPDLLDNRAGVIDVLLSPAGCLEQWEATIYAGWLYYRNHPTISREVLSKLFNRTADTLRYWENTRLNKIVSVRNNYAQCDSADVWEKFRPETTLSYVARTKDGNKSRFLWQISNTYLVKGIREHRHKGQAKKVRKAVNQQLLEQPANSRRGGSPVRKLYFDSPKRLRQHLKKHEGAYYLWRGENRHNHGIFEATDTGWSETHAKERLSFSQERKIWAEGRVRLQT